jgi:anti-anti-sigma factor
MFEVTRTEDPRGFRLSGELDIATAEKLSAALAPELEEGGDLVLDLAELDFMDSSGLRAIIQAALALRGTGQIVLSSATAPVRRVFEVSGLGRVPGIQIRDDDAPST